jgi:hypothetical protein
MKLTVFERLTLQNILPREGDFITLKLVRKLREALAFSEKEIAEINFRNHWKCPECQRVELSAEVIKCPDCGIYMILAGQVTWDEDKAIIKDVHMGDTMLALCKTTIKKLSDEQKLKEEQMSLYQKFVEAEEE